VPWSGGGGKLRERDRGMANRLGLNRAVKPATAAANEQLRSKATMGFRLRPALETRKEKCVLHRKAVLGGRAMQPPLRVVAKRTPTPASFPSSLAVFFPVFCDACAFSRSVRSHPFSLLN
jgi:hypothetical protein